MLKFRRALHHVAFNLTASISGIDRMYGSEFNPAREYIKRPKGNEEWPFGQYVISLDQIDKVVLGGLYQRNADEYVGLRLYNVAFFVALLSRDGFATFLQNQQPKARY